MGGEGGDPSCARQLIKKVAPLGCGGSVTRRLWRGPWQCAPGGGGRVRCLEVLF